MNLSFFLSPWLSKVIALFLLMLAAAQLASLTWKILPVPDVLNLASDVSTAQNLPSAPKMLSDISRYHLFGQYVPPRQVPPPPVATRPAPPPKPPLSINIFGIIASDNPKRARAIFSVGDRGTQEVYAIGDAIPKDFENKGLAKEAILKKITADSITIDQNGVEQVYYYQQGKTSLGQVVTSVVSTTPAAASSPIFASRAPPLPAARQEQLLGEVKNRLQNNPASLQQFVRLSIYNEGNSMAGFRIYPRAGQEDYFQALGLEKEDIVTSINGRSLTSTQEAMQALNELTKATTVNLLVRRNGLEVPVSVHLPQ
jgi:general secretion pathway protein C